MDAGDEEARRQPMTLAEREEAYSPSSRIGGDYAPYVAAYRERSAEARARIDRWQEHAYGEAPRQRLDLFMPPDSDGGQLPPLLVFIHGGYWQELSKADSSFAAPAWVDRGVAFAAVDHTLAPAASLHEIVAECRQAVRWLHGHADELGIDPHRIVVSGNSAGAHLAAMVAGADDLVSATVLISGIFDLSPLVGTSIAEPLGLSAADAEALSPALLPVDGFPRSIVCWGEVETEAFKEQSRRFAASLLASGTSCTSFEVEARNHFDVVLDLADPASAIGNGLASLFDEATPGAS